MIKVFVIDDSITVRNGFKEILSKVEDIELLGSAQNPVDALEDFAKTGLPDLFILDIEMPKMDGITFLKKINLQRPTPVIICSSFVGPGTGALIDALRLGASDIIEKPKSDLNDLFLSYKEELLSKIRLIAKANINYRNDINIAVKSTQILQETSLPSSKLIAIASSTGGVQVLEEIFTHLKKSHSGIIVVQHIPKEFSLSLAKRLNDICSNSFVKEAKEGDLVRDNTIYIAPGGLHIEVYREALKYYLRLCNTPKVNSHRPSANVLFDSIAEVAKINAQGFILTGMGDDGATGLKKMKEAGAKTYVQNRKTSTVYGMPKVAWEMGSAVKQLSIYEMIQVINES